MGKAKGRNYYLDIFKLFASYMVVLIHFQLYGKLGKVVAEVAAFAVPFFFIISGYYAANGSAEKIKTKAIKMFKMFIACFIFYLIFDIIYYFIVDEFSIAFLRFQKFFSVKNFVLLFCTNNVLYYLKIEFSWYLLAITQIYIIYYYLKKHNIQNKEFYFVSFVLLIMNIVITVLFYFIGDPNDTMTHNFLLTGIPYFGIGLFFKDVEHKLKKISNGIIITIIVVTVIKIGLLTFFFNMTEFRIGPGLIAISLFTFAINNKKEYSNNNFPHYSELIYIFHIFCGNMIQITLMYIGCNYKDYVNLSSILTCIITTIVAHIFICFKQRKQTLDE